MMVATLEVAEYAVVGVDGVRAVALVLPQKVSIRHVAVNGWRRIAHQGFRRVLVFGGGMCAIRVGW